MHLMSFAKMVKSSAYILLSSSLLSQTYAQLPSRSWPGWEEISNIFVFGDSYSDTGFQVNGTQPNPSNPLGNPEFPGRTFSNGRNWVDFLSYTYNDSYVQTYNLAKGGASVDSFGLPNPFRPFDQQVEKFFLPSYAQNNTTLATWRSDNTLFTSFFGINDVNLFYKFNNATAVAAMIMSTYASLVEDLYQAGARNFLFMNVPPINRAPFTVNQGDMSKTFVEMNRVAVADFNMRITNMVGRLVEQHTDTTVFLFDTFRLFNAVLNEPESRKETAGYKDTTGFCFAYSA